MATFSILYWICYHPSMQYHALFQHSSTTTVSRRQGACLQGRGSKQIRNLLAGARSWLPMFFVWSLKIFERFSVWLLLSQKFEKVWKVLLWMRLPFWLPLVFSMTIFIVHWCSLFLRCVLSVFIVFFTVFGLFVISVYCFYMFLTSLHWFHIVFIQFYHTVHPPPYFHHLKSSYCSKKIWAYCMLQGFFHGAARAFWK